MAMKDWKKTWEGGVTNNIIWDKIDGKLRIVVNGNYGKEVVYWETKLIDAKSIKTIRKRKAVTRPEAIKYAKAYMRKN